MRKYFIGHMISFMALMNWTRSIQFYGLVDSHKRTKSAKKALSEQLERIFDSYFRKHR